MSSWLRGILPRGIFGRGGGRVKEGGNGDWKSKIENWNIGKSRSEIRRFKIGVGRLFWWLNDWIFSVPWKGKFLASYIEIFHLFIHQAFINSAICFNCLQLPQFTCDSLVKIRISKRPYEWRRSKWIDLMKWSYYDISGISYVSRCDEID